MRPVTLYLTGVPQFVKLVDLSYNLDLLFDTNDIGTFELRDVSHYLGKRKIALDFSSCYDAFAAQSRLNGYIYVLPNGQEYMLNAKLAKKDMALRSVGSGWRSPSPVERAGRDWDANDALAVLPTMSEGVLDRAHSKLDAQLDLLKKQKLILKAQKQVLKAKKKLHKEYTKVDVASVGEPNLSGHNPLPRDPSRSESKSRERRRSPMNPPGTPIETTTTPTIETKEKKSPKSLQKKAKKTCKHRSRSRKRSRSKTRERSRSKHRRRSSSKSRRSSSKNRHSRSRSRRSCSGSQRRSRSKNHRPESRRSRSHYCRSRSRSRNARIRWRSRTRDWSRSRDYSPFRARVRTLRSPEFNRNRSRSRDRLYTRRRQFIGKSSVSSSPSSEPYTRQLAIMAGPIQDSQSIIVKRKISADPVIDYISNNPVTNFHESSPRGMRYRCAADKDETVSKCTELYDTNDIVSGIIPENDDFSIDVDVKPIIDSENIPPLKEIKEEFPSLLKPLELVVNEDSNIDEVVKPVTQLAELPGIYKKSPLLPKRPKFVLIIRHLMKEMGASIRKVKQDFKKMSFQCKFKYVLRVMLREIVLGKDRMNKSEIMRSFRDRYPRELDDEFARRVVEDIQAGKYGNLGPSDDELSDDPVGDDLVLVENKDETIVISDSDDESEVPQTTNEQSSRRLAWAEWARARGLTPKKPFKIFAPNTMTPRVLIPYPTSMGPLPDKENMQPGVNRIETEKNEIVPEFTDTEVENLLKSIEKVEPGTADPREGTETPHVTGITIMTSLSELFALKYGKQVPIKEEKEIKIEQNPLTEEYMNDDAQYYNPYKD